MTSNNNIPQGYKQTDLGVIPDDWEIKPLGEIGKFSKGSGISLVETCTGNIPCVRYGELYTHHNDFIKKFSSYISKEVASRAKLIKYGDILFAASGETKEDIGKSVAFIHDIEAYAGGDIIILSTKPSLCDAKYIGFVSNSSSSIKQKGSRGQGDAVVHITCESISNIFIPFPPISEQKAIAKALSDVDALITALDKKIAKKKLIKQGAMQQLLTGKKRLPGFTEEWLYMSLEELFEYEQPTKYLVSSTEYTESGIPVLTAGKTFILGYTTETIGIYTNVPVIIFDDFTTESKFVTMPFKAKSSAMKMLQLRDRRYHIRLIYELMQLIQFPLYDHQRYWISEYSRLKVCVPTNLEEQQAIATILSDMDKEITDLETKRDKYRQIKSGMMQKLLTGQIRLNK